MKFGLFYLPTYLPAVRDAQTHYRGIIEQIEFADRIGIDYAWIVEHHFVRHGGLFPSNFAFLSYLAGRTKRIRLGTGATVLPLNDPVRVAEQGATLDQLVAGPIRFRRRPRLHSRRVRHLRRRHEGKPRAGRGRRRTGQAGLDRPDHGVQQQIPAAVVGHAAAAAGLPEAASADLGGVPDVAGELRMDGAGGLQPALRRLSRRPSGRGRANRLVSRRVAKNGRRRRRPRGLLRLSRAFPGER